MEKRSRTPAAPATSTKPKAGWNVPVVILAVAMGMIVYRNAVYAKDPLVYMIPNFLMYTPFRQLTNDMWSKVLQYPKEKVAPVPIPELQASEYSYEALRKATNDFKSPAVVRGLFLNTTAMARWIEPGYLSSKIGEYEVPVVRAAYHDKGQEDRVKMKIGDVAETILSDPTTRLYMFFPVKSRFQNTNESQIVLETKLASDVNDLVRTDLELDRFWQGFGTDAHQTFRGSQMIAGNGMKDEKDTTGTGWHCAPGNNWFIQVAGSKRWYFLDQEYSAYLKPQRGGVVNMATGTLEMSTLMQYLPVKYTDVYAGDFLYNPDWQWHTIRNYEGLSIGCPIRELNLTYSLRNNFQYSMITLINIGLAQFGITYGLSSVG